MNLTKNHESRRRAIITMFLLLAASLCSAQGGAQADSPERNDLPFFELGFMIPTIKASENSHVGFGGRAVFNPHPLLSVELEANHIFVATEKNRINHPNRAGFDELFVGVKSGYRFRHVGSFAKARPGYLTFVQFIPPNRRERFVKRPAFDLGLVFEFYMSKHWAFRTDVGDTMAFYNSRFLQDVDVGGVTRHNLQSGFAIQYRF